MDWNPQEDSYELLIEKLEKGLEAYRADYKAYYEACKHPDSPAMRDPNPTVILIPGLGLIAWCRNKSESRVTAEFYSLAIEVMRASEAISEYLGLPRQEAFDIEYWLLEEAKLKRMPLEKEFARNIVVVIGAESGIGKAAAHRVAKEGAHVVCADLSAHDSATSGHMERGSHRVSGRRWSSRAGTLAIWHLYVPRTGRREAGASRGWLLVHRPASPLACDTADLFALTPSP